MGSSTTIDSSIKNTMADHKKKSIKHILLNIFGGKKNKETDAKHKDKVNEVEYKENAVKQKPVLKVDALTLVENFKRLELEKKKNVKQKEEEDELNNFSFKTFEKDRTKSNSSQDSGFDEKEDVIKTEDETSSIAEEEKEKNAEDIKKENGTKTDEVKKEEDLVESLCNLKIEDGKKKKSQLVPVSRGPIRNRTGDLSGYHPYGTDTQTQVNHTVNRQTFSGGQVIVSSKSPQLAYDQLDLDLVINAAQDLAAADLDLSLELQAFDKDLESIGVHHAESFDWDILQEVIEEDNFNDFSNYANYPNNNTYNEQVISIIPTVDSHIEPNPIEELENARASHVNYDNVELLDTELGLQNKDYTTDIYETSYPTPPSAETMHSPSSNEFYTNFLTPPRSETIPSPLSGSSILSPTSDCEKYQEIPPYDEYNISSSDILNAAEDGAEKKARERNASTSSLSMKNFKDLQKELAAKFSKKECCQITRRPVREIFEEHLKKLKPEKRKDMCCQIASMDFKQIYGTLHNVLIHLSGGSADDLDKHLHLGLFALLCDKVLGTKPDLFLGDFGLNILEAASLRCPRYPVLTRYLVHCIRTVAKQNPLLLEGKQYLFKETDALGDNLVIAVTRGGDTHANVLSELVRKEPHDLPLFNVNHSNIDGNSALHVSCREHSAASSFLHTTHVLLEHGHANIWMEDTKGGDTPVHMAVTSSTCQLSLVLSLFHHLHRQQWKKLAHKHNRSQLSPLDNARSASKSRATFPTEVLEFLKKCR